MAESLGASAAKVKVTNRTGFKARHQHDDDCGTDAHGKVQHDHDAGGGGCKHYVSLHHHSTYSYLDGFALPESHVRRATEIEMGALALTEHGNISSHVQLEQAAKDQGVKPLFGCELYTGKVGEEGTQRKNHLTVLAEDQDGYRNLLRLVTRSWDQFYYEPTASWRDLQEFGDGLVILSGCTGSLLSTSLIGGKNVPEAEAGYGRGKKVAKEFKRVFGDGYYLEVQAFPELENVRRLNKMMERLSRELDIPLVATGDVHYTSPNENEMQQILHNVRGGNRKTLEEMSREWGYDVPLSPPTSDLYVYRRLRATGLSHTAAREAVLNTGQIADRCNVELPKLDMVRFPVPEGYESSHDVWRAWIKKGWDYRRIADKKNVREYKEQLHREMKVIEDKDYLDYFLIVADLVIYAKDRGIPVGPGRGSSAASLVCYLLRITEVDPLAFPNLLFERFIDPTRKDLPDIDIDFADNRRHEVYEYAEAKYGIDRVGNIGSFIKYKSKNSLDDVARVYRIPQYEVDKVKELLIERSSGDLRASATIEDTATSFEQAADVFEKYPNLAHAIQLEGNVKGMGVHAAGMVIASGPLTDACAAYVRKMGDGRMLRVLSVDKHDAEYLNILKIDNLGLTTLGMIYRCLDLIGRPLEWLYEIPLDDAETIEGFKANDTVGIFQFDGRAMRGVTAELKPDNFLEVCDLTALARPGPLHNGAAAEYIDVKHGRKAERQFHPLVQKIVSYTHGQIVYQEQILRITGEVGGFDHVHRATIRKIISKKLGEQEFNRWWLEFWEGAEKRGLTEPQAKEIWNACITAGSYAFNVAHSLGYGMLAWWTMYLKKHHPLEFYAASLASYGDGKQLELLKDAARHDVPAYPPLMHFSGMDWTVSGTAMFPTEGLLAGYSQISGVGEKTGQVIKDWLEEHPEVEPDDWYALQDIKGIGPKTVERIVDFIKSDDPFDIHKLDRMVDQAKSIIRKTRHLPKPTHTAANVPYQRGADTEVVWVGVLTKRNLKELFEVHYSRTGEELQRDEVKDPDLNEWVVMWGDDGTDVLTITVDRWRYPKLREALWAAKLDKDVVLIRGVKKGFQSRRAIYADQIWVFGEDEDEE